MSETKYIFCHDVKHKVEMGLAGIVCAYQGRFIITYIENHCNRKNHDHNRNS